MLYGEKELFFDTSSTLWYLPPQTAKKLLHRMDSEHICFGTDYPVFRIRDELSLFDRLDLPERFAEKILWENAHRFLENVPCPTAAPGFRQCSQ